MDWNKRMRIALGAARGLLYLHEQCNPKIIHRDVKAANILLDESFEAVVGDFGLAKLLDQRDSHVTTAVRGTLGHIAPEYLSTGQSSEKSDVFGYGILLLELITGYKALDTRNGQAGKGMILDWVSKLPIRLLYSFICCAVLHLICFMIYTTLTGDISAYQKYYRHLALCLLCLFNREFIFLNLAH